MSRFNFRRIWFPVIVLDLMVAFGLLPLLIIIHWPLVTGLQNGNPVSPDYIRDSWPPMILFDVLLGGVVIWSHLLMLPHLLTVFTSDGVKQRYIVGNKFIRWSEVTDMILKTDPFGGNVIILKSPLSTITINLSFFVDKQEVIDEVCKHVSPNALGKLGT